MQQGGRRRKRSWHTSVTYWTSRSKWKLSVFFPDPITGETRKEVRTFPSEAEAFGEKRDADRNLSRGLPWDGVKRAPEAGVEQVLKTYRAPGRGEGGIAPGSLLRIADFNKHLIRLLGKDGPVAGLVPDDLFAYQEKRFGEKASIATVARELGHLRAACRSARVNRRISGHPFEQLDKQARRSLVPQSTPKGREVLDEEFERIMGFVPSRYQGVLRFIRATGMTRGTACERLLWENLTKTSIEIPHPTKKRGSFSIPIGEVRNLLPPQPITGRRGRIFRAPDGESLDSGLGTAWDRARKKAGSNARIHEIGKHSAITAMAKAGTNVDDISAATGTRAETIRSWYLHAKTERAASAFEKLGAYRKAEAAKAKLQTSDSESAG